MTNTSRYTEMFAQIIDVHMPRPSVNFSESDQTPFDILMEQRRFNIQQTHEQAIAQGLMRSGTATEAIDSCIPKELSRVYQVVIVHAAHGKKTLCRMREIRGQNIGSLVTIRGIVVRASDVKP